jgi:hypothetical protein
MEGLGRGVTQNLFLSRMMSMKFLHILLPLLISSNAFALVDYSDADDFKPKNSGAESVKRNPPPSSSSSSVSEAPKQRAVRRQGKALFSLGSSYESVNYHLGANSGKVDFTRFAGRFQTNYGVFIDANYWRADNKSSLLGEKGDMAGNPEVVLGFNWLEFGGRENGTDIILKAGASIAEQGNNFARSGTDKIVGIETSKRFYDFALGLGYDYRLTGTPGAIEEAQIGNIGKLYASFGWMATPDIQFSVDAATYSIKGSDDETRLNRISNNLSFGYISPKLTLGLSPLFALELGALFRTKRLSDESTVNARLWNFPGAYGNSIFAGLGIAL